MNTRTFTYGDPATKTSASPKPPCWGTSKFDNEDRECRACGYQHTCREQTIKAKAAQAPTPATSYFSQFQPAVPYAAPQTIVQAPQTTPIPVAPRVVPIPTQQVPQAAPPISPGIQDRYGQFQDPMFATLKSSPSVMRPQLPGEQFHQRVMKNMALAGVEAALGEVLLGVRQFLWTPNDEDKKK